jgi:copper chaperone NosL
MTKLKTISRVIIILSALLMVISYFVPIWQILMWAPQYPEGLEMKIWLHTLSGDYKIISGLNHYIGMKHIEIDMFPEFEYMRYVVAGMIFFGVVTALVNKRFLLISYVAVILLAAAAGLVDFYNWGYDYGHNLDPTAPIIVPGMAYQPPLIGTKQLLNFTAFSGPDTGGYIFLVSGLLAIGILIYEIKFSAKRVAIPTAVFWAMFFMLSCSSSPEPIQFGKDGCYSCKMTLVDKRFGAEIVTKKGKTYKFDDVSCMIDFMRTGEVPSSEIKHELLIDYAQPEKLIDAATATLVHSDNIRSPMNGNIAAFSTKESADKHNGQWKGEVTSWSALKASKLE